MSTAKLRVTGVVIGKLLRLPPDSIVQGVEIVVSHPDIPEGATHVEPLFREHQRGPRTFLGWQTLGPSTAPPS